MFFKWSGGIPLKYLIQKNLVYLVDTFRYHPMSRMRKLCTSLQVTPANQRCIIGCCLTTGSANSAQEGMLQDAGYSMWTFPKCSRAIITEFPLRSMLSIIIAPSCVYPAISKYIKVSSLFYNKQFLELQPVLWKLTNKYLQNNCVHHAYIHI